MSDPLPRLMDLALYFLLILFFLFSLHPYPFILLECFHSPSIAIENKDILAEKSEKASTLRIFSESASCPINLIVPYPEILQHMYFSLHMYSPLYHSCLYPVLFFSLEYKKCQSQFHPSRAGSMLHLLALHLIQSDRESWVSRVRLPRLESQLRHFEPRFIYLTKNNNYLWGVYFNTKLVSVLSGI